MTQEETEQLNACLKHFWNSAYWSEELKKLPELSEDVKNILLAKSVEIDNLRYQLAKRKIVKAIEIAPECEHVWKSRLVCEKCGIEY